MTEPKLGLAGLGFRDLFQIPGLQKLDEEFLARLRGQNPRLYADLLAYRQGRRFTPLEISALLLACAPPLEELLAELFGIEAALEQSRRRTLAHDPVFAFKKLFVLRRARRRLALKEEIESFAALDQWLDGALNAAKLAMPDREWAVARFAGDLLGEPEANAEGIEKLTRWCMRALSTPEGKRAVHGWVSFRLPQGLDYRHLVPIKAVTGDRIGRGEALDHNRRLRDGFKLTDERMSEREVQNEVRYCIYCHDHDGDFCSKGFPQKKGAPEQGLKVNPLGTILTGCPLDEKISEMHTLKRDGHTIAALAVAMVDNPMVAATGHRICNDCMKACIYQKQEPVNIPQIETGVLVDVLNLPWGVEIYDLLVRWNPLRPRQWLPKPYNGRKILIAGMGPGGFTLAHHLLMEGFAVVGIDGLKIEPLPEALLQRAIQNYADLKEELDERVMSGFGGVAEYGITVRWDKNFLKLIHLTLARRPHFQVFGGVRLGGTVTLEDAWELGFDHVSIATGTGLPRALPIGNSLACGMRQAVDFLMALQLTGAAKASSLTNLQVRMPAVVIGGGLTGVDTATEVQAYYIAQVEKILTRYERLACVCGEASLRESLDPASIGILNEFLAHGRAVRQERARAAATGVPPDFQPLLRSLGGVTIAYRRAINESPAYVRNHEEIAKALEEGIYYAEGLDPQAARLDAHGHIAALVCRRRISDDAGNWRLSEEQVELPARSIFVAAGVAPNTIYEREYPGTFKMQGAHFKPHHEKDALLAPIEVVEHCKIEDFGPFTSYEKNDRRVSFLGDTHPVFHGSVVKAIASGLRTYPKIVRILGVEASTLGDVSEYAAFRVRMEDLLQPKVELVKRRSPSVVEIQVRAPMAAKNFRPGQFFRLQNFERHARLLEGTRLQTEALALTGAGVDREKGRVSLMILEVGASSRLCATLRANDPVVLMGPTGSPTEIPSGQTVMLIGGRRGAAMARVLGPALRSAGNRVLYFAGFQTADEVYCQDELEQAADVIVWCTTRGEPVAVHRTQDVSCTGEFVHILHRYAEGGLNHNGRPPIPLEEVDRMLVVGSNRLLRRVQAARRGALREYFIKSPAAIASIGSPMQCMLKGVCSQCLQWHIDPTTGARTHAVFSCFQQDQPLDWIDLDNLDARLNQNRLQEQLTNLWLDYLFTRHDIARV